MGRCLLVDLTAAEQDGEVAQWNGGVPYTDDGRVLITVESTPPPPINFVQTADMTAGREGNKRGYDADDYGSMFPTVGPAYTLTRLFTRGAQGNAIELWAERNDGQPLQNEGWTSMTVDGQVLLREDANFNGNRWRWNGYAGAAFVEGNDYVVEFA
jgi:hypothetical protein